MHDESGWKCLPAQCSPVGFHLISGREELVAFDHCV